MIFWLEGVRGLDVTDMHIDGANKIIQDQYPGRKVIGIDVLNLYENGGMVHCITQQQPAGNRER
ncbi:agmatine deiminase family protein [uncultured Chryseobacterium sp.]|uniref:agmatine deiminase family protein n=1 Tax=uncultured Chryseobacterium sp. TaxID=259322 RepID=UPI00259062D1|nr:agmatine deiminase family protein [uncultured Chryseobacterium sp.]